SFFFQAEDGIRDFHVTGVQTCALPIYYTDRVIKTCFNYSICIMHYSSLDKMFIAYTACPSFYIFAIFTTYNDIIAIPNYKFAIRSEERRVGKECGSRWARSD